MAIARSVAGSGENPAAGYWPTEFSSQPEFSIGQVVESLQREFPSVVVSKIRFFNNEGLISPHRSASGYRRFSRADVERLRYILVLQRDKYLPLKVIKEQLERLDAGQVVVEVPAARLIAKDGRLVGQHGRAALSAREVMDLTSATEEELAEMVRSGFIQLDIRGLFHTDALPIVEKLLLLGRQGIEVRHLRALLTSAMRCADLVDQVVTPAKTGRSGPVKERAELRSTELAGLLSHLQSDLIRAAVAKLH